MLDYAVSIKYMLAGYGIIFLVLSGYLISLYVRWKNLTRDYQTLFALMKKDE